MSHPVCHAHPMTPAVASCSLCFVALCDVCRVLDGMRPFCADCLRKERRAPGVRRALAVVALAAIGGGGYWAYKTYEAPYDYGRGSGEIGKLQAALAKEPCDRPKAMELLKRMLAAGDNRGVLDRDAAFSTQCGVDPHRREVTYLAHKRLGELDMATSDLTSLIEGSPESPYFRAWRAAIYQEQGDLDRAALDLQKAWVLYPAATDIPLNLATLYEKQGKYCDATAPLQELVIRYPRESFTVSVRARLDELEKKGACGVTVTGKDRVTLRTPSSRGVIRAKVRLCDREDGAFVVDTGASFVTLTRALAGRLGLDLSAAPKAELHTANGTREGAFVILSSVAIEGLSTERVPAMIVDDLGPGLDGLLGMSFLSRFELRQAGGVVELSARAAAPAASAASAASAAPQ